jgi:hypothetical protein
VLAPVPNETLEQAGANPLGDLDTVGTIDAVGAIGTGPAGNADVQWFQFTLSHPSQVQLAAQGQSGPSSFQPVVSLYNADSPDLLSPYAYAGDPYTSLDHRLIAQSVAGSTGSASVARDLGLGTYDIAISGAGNENFNPYVADSGLPGSTGSYQLQVSATSLATTSTPTVLSSDPAPGAVLDRSPFVLRLDLDQPLSPSAIDPSLGDPGQTFRLLSSPTPDFTDPNTSEVSLASAAFSPALNELQLTPTSPLPPAYYLLLANFDGRPLGVTPTAPGTAAYRLSFQINGAEGIPAPSANVGLIPADDTPATAHQLIFTAQGTARAAGAIGDDPYYTPLTDPYAGDEFDVYHFTVTGPGPHAFVAETWAGRIGSPLFAEESLFQAVTDSSGQTTYVLLASNAGTGNPTPATGGPIAEPLASDPVLFAGLQAGDYYLAISNSGGVPDLNQPSHTFSSNSVSTGDYILHVQLQADALPPQVSAVSPSPGATLSAPPTSVTIRFSKLMNLQQLQAAEQSGSVYLQGSDGAVVSLRFESYDFATNQAVFLPLVGLRNGPAQLHLVGLTDVAGNPLGADTLTGDDVIPFTVQGPVRGTNFAQPLVWQDTGNNYQAATAQDLGVLFPLELQETTVIDPVTMQPSFVGGVTINRDFASQAASGSDTTDYYQFQLLQNARTYAFNFSSAGLPPGLLLTLTDAAGNLYPTPDLLSPLLGPGRYMLAISGLPSSVSGPASYSLVLTIAESGDNPPPLNLGPAPAVRLQLLATPTVPPPTVAPSAPGLVIPTSAPASSAAGIIPAAAPAGMPAATSTSLTDVFFALSSGPLGGIRSEGLVPPPAPAPALRLGNLSSELPGTRLANAILPASGADGSEAGTTTGRPQTAQDLSLWQNLLQHLYQWFLADPNVAPESTETSDQDAQGTSSPAASCDPGLAGDPESMGGETSDQDTGEPSADAACVGPTGPVAARAAEV